MKSNHFIIGLGGTGGKIIRSFRKAMYQEFRGSTVEGVNLAYLYVDSSNEMMAIEDASWKILGTSVQLNKRSQLLKEAFQGARGGNVEIIDSDAKPNEIALISLTDLFPLRYVKQVAFLKEKYDQRLKGSNGPRARLELHLEGDGSQYPRIFVPRQDEMKRDALPYLLLAKALGMIQEEVNTRTGSTGLFFVSKDDSGSDTDPIDLGKNLIEAVTRIDIEGADLIRAHVTQLLRSDFTEDSKRSALQKQVVANVDQIKVLRGGSASDEVYGQFRDAGRLAVKIIRPEN